jgi:hypothetical protein
VVRRRLAGEGPEETASALGRTSRWVRKWVARHGEEGGGETWAPDRSRAPHRSPNRTPDELVELIPAARGRLGNSPVGPITGPRVLAHALYAMRPIPRVWRVIRRPLVP